MSNTTDARRYPRRPFEGRATVEIHGPDGDQVVAVAGTFESLSQSGAGLALDDGIPVNLDRGELVELCFFAAPRGRRSSAARVPARVAWARHRDGRYRVGAEFLFESLTQREVELVRRLFDDEPVYEPDSVTSAVFAAETPVWQASAPSAGEG